jgi:hypothetical protein
VTAAAGVAEVEEEVGRLGVVHDRDGRPPFASAGTGSICTFVTASSRTKRSKFVSVCMTEMCPFGLIAKE